LFRQKKLIRNGYYKIISSKGFSLGYKETLNQDENPIMGKNVANNLGQAWIPAANIF
jgi:hypothetical protein